MAVGSVRPARPEDAAEIARIQLSPGRTAYRGMFPPHVLANLDEAYLARGWTEAITAPPSARHRVLVAVEQGESRASTVGFTAAGPPDEQARARQPPAGRRGGPVARRRFQGCGRLGVRRGHHHAEVPHLHGLGTGRCG